MEKEKELENSLYNYALEGKRDGFKNYDTCRRRKILDRLIAEKFGIETE